MKPSKNLEIDAITFSLILRVGIVSSLSSKKFGKRVFALSSDRATLLI
jgi:hypothetical protein